MPDISIVMLVRNERANLVQSLPLLAAQQIDAPYELLVIDSGSVDGTVELVREWQPRFARLRLVEIPPAEFHHARTRNRGAALAAGRYVVFLGGDAVPTSDRWLHDLVEPVRSGEGTRVIASYGRQVPRSDADACNACRISFNYGEDPILKSVDAALSPKDMYFFSSVNCCIDVGLASRDLFDERFPVNEDWSFSARVLRGGYRIVYVPEAAVVHSHNYRLRQMLRRSFDNGVIFRELGILESARRDAGGDALAYVRGAWRRLGSQSLATRLMFLLFFVASGVGLQLGLSHRRLPRALTRALSVYGTTRA